MQEAKSSIWSACWGTDGKSRLPREVSTSIPRYPYAGLIQGSDGNFYGTTYGGAHASNGTLFRITSAGTLTTLVAFDGFDDGAHPASALVEGRDGALYGTTTTSGPGGRGTIFPSRRNHRRRQRDKGRRRRIE